MPTDNQNNPPATKPVLFSLSKIKDVEPGATVMMSLSVDGDYQARNINAVVSYDPAVLTLTEAKAGKLLAENDDATVALSYKSTPGSVRILASAGSEMISGSGSLVKLTFDIEQKLDEAVFVTPEIREFTDPSGARIDFIASDGVMIPAEGVAAPVPEPAPEPEYEPVPEPEYEPAVQTATERFKLSSIYALDTVVNSEPVTTTFSCTGNQSVDVLSARVTFDASRLSYRDYSTADLSKKNVTVSVMMIASNVLQIVAESSDGTRFVAGGKIAELRFDVLKAEPSTISLEVGQFGCKVPEGFKAFSLNTTDAEVAFYYVAPNNIIERFALSDIDNAERSKTVTTTLSCAGGQMVNKLTARVTYDPEYLKYSSYCSGELSKTYPDLKTSVAREGKDTLTITVERSNYLYGEVDFFKAAGKLVNLSFEVLKTSADPSTLVLTIGTFGAVLKSGYTKRESEAANGRVTFKRVPEAVAPEPKPEPKPVPTPDPKPEPKPEEKPEQKPEEKPVDPDKPGPCDIKTEKNEDAKVPNTTNTTSAIGFGYNYLSTNRDELFSSKGRIINLATIENPTRAIRKEDSLFDYMTEKSASSLTKKFSESASINVGVGLFKTQLEESYSSSTSKSKEFAYSMVYVDQVRVSEALRENIHWKSLLTNDFWKELHDEKITPEKLFAKWGTHVILQAKYGGFMELTGLTEKLTEDTTESLELNLGFSCGMAEAGVTPKPNMTADEILNLYKTNNLLKDVPKEVIIALMTPAEAKKEEKAKNSIDVSVKTSYVETEHLEKQTLTFKGKTIGGNGKIPTTLDAFVSSANTWIDSVKDAGVFVGIPKVNGDKELAAYPIWKLLEQPQELPRRLELEWYYKQEASKLQRFLDEEDRYITDIRFIWKASEEEANSVANVFVKDGWACDRHDLNKGVRCSGFLYLCYKTESIFEMKKSGHRPITGLFLYFDDKKHKNYYYDRYEDWKKKLTSLKLNHGVSSIDIGSNFDYVGTEWPRENYLSFEGTPHFTDEYQKYYDNYNPYDGSSKQISNLNHGMATLGRFILLCYTRDTRLPPLTAMCSYYSKDEFKSVHASGEWQDIRALGREPEDLLSTNAGHDGCKTVYLAFKRSNELLDVDALIKQEKAELDKAKAEAEKKKAEAEKAAREKNRFAHNVGMFNAFPYTLAEACAKVVAKIPNAAACNEKNTWIAAYGADEEWYCTCQEDLRIPYRINYPDSNAVYKSLPDATSKLIYDCIFTRHLDGHIREKHLRNIFKSKELPKWCMPFIMRLAGEYVVEILQVIYDQLKKRSATDLSMVREYGRVNRLVAKKNYSRMTNFWGRYYQKQGSLRNYVGKKLFDEFLLYKRKNPKKK